MIKAGVPGKPLRWHSNKLEAQLVTASNGRIVALNFAGTTDESASNRFAIRIDVVQRFLQQIDGGEVLPVSLAELVIDSDGDGFSDTQETIGEIGTDPFDPTDNPNDVRDTDNDGCSDYDEINFQGFCDGDPLTAARPRL